MSKNKKHQILGKLPNHSGQLIANLVVQALDDYLNTGMDYLGAAISDESDKYKISYDWGAVVQPWESGGEHHWRI